jgi:hypothetical protein
VIAFTRIVSTFAAVKPLSTVLMLLACVTAGRLPASAQSDWHDPFPPHRIAIAPKPFAKPSGNSGNGR